MKRDCDILIVGGGTGGVAAALAAAGSGHRILLTEETDWLGGQFTAQAVPPDEHPWIESFGCTRSYRALREGIRNYYRDFYQLTRAVREDPHFNPGGGNVSRLCHEPRVALAVLEQMLAFRRSQGLLEIRLHRRPIAAETDGHAIRSVTFQNLVSGATETLTALYVLDATELGDLLPLAGVEYVSGAEAQSETGELHAPDVADPENVQGLTWCFPMGFGPDGEHPIDKPAMYDFWRGHVPSLTPTDWPGPLIDWTYPSPLTLEPKQSCLSPEPDKISLWDYRKIIRSNRSSLNRSKRFPMLQEATLVNWPQNDYFLKNIIDKPEEIVQQALYEAKQLSLSLFYWLQTEAPRPDGGIGYPGLRLRPDLVGTDDGLAKSPYIRESRRIRAVFTVTEAHVGTEMRRLDGADTASEFFDSVGIGCYRIDLHPSASGTNYLDISSLPFQIPLGALLPVRVKNLLPACKNLGVTHITNGCYRLHPVEWNIGEAAGLLAAFCLIHDTEPHQVREDARRLADFQKLLRSFGVELEWPRLRAV